MNVCALQKKRLIIWLIGAGFFCLSCVCGGFTIAWAQAQPIPSKATPLSKTQPTSRPAAPKRPMVRANGRSSRKQSKPTSSQNNVRKKSVRSPPVYQSTTRARVYRAQTAASGQLSQQQLQTQASRTATDVLQRVPGLQSSQHSGRGKARQFYLRGFDAGHGSDIEIRVQGIPINEVAHIHGQGYADLGFVPFPAIQHLRYQKGSFAGEQGEFGMVGTFDFALALSSRGLLVEASLGSFWQKEVTVLWGPVGHPNATFVAGSFGHSDGFGEQRSWLDGKVLAQKQFRWRSLRFRFLAAVHTSRFATAGLQRYADWERKKVGFYDAQWSGLGGHSSRALVQAQMLWRGEEQRLHLMLYTIARDFLLRDNFTGFLQYEEGDMFQQIHRFVQHGGQARWSREGYLWGRTQRVFVGLEWRGDHIQQSQERLRTDQTVHTQEISASIQRLRVALWAELRLRLSRALWWRVSLRATAFVTQAKDLLPSSKPQTAPTLFHIPLMPRTVMRLRLHRFVSLFGAYGMGIRSPEVSSRQEASSAPVQHVHNAEWGLRFRGKGVNASLAWFGAYISDELLFEHSEARYQSFGESWRTGVEAYVETPLFVRWLGWDASLTYAEGVFLRDAAPVPSAPRLILRTGLAARWHSKDHMWSGLVALRISYLGSRPLPMGLKSHVVFLTNAMAQISFRQFYLRFSVQNLFNQKWMDAQFVYSSALRPDPLHSRLPQLHYAAGSPLQFLVSVGFSSASNPSGMEGHRHE